ncbi:MAG: AraC family transcriptional regulator [Clostridia bacterium]|nr:AraC family transcriptional regulator [Clostridia bacterium]
MDHEIEIARCLHYTTGVPVCLKRGDTVLCSLPEKITSAAVLTGNTALGPDPGGEQEGSRYISTLAGEQYIIYDLPASSAAKGRPRLFIGPVLTEPVPCGLLTELARTGSIRISQRAVLQEYLNGLKQITARSYFYLGRLAELLFTREKETDSTVLSENIAMIDSSFYEQTRDYRTQQFSHSPYMIEQEISHCISVGDTKGALHILSEINRRPRARLAGSVLRSLKNSVICSATFMARAAIAGGVDPDEAFTLSDTYIQRAEICRDIKELQDLERQMVSGYAEAVNGTRSVRYSVQIGSAVNYINTHLCEPLTVQEIAGHVFLSANYLSGLFKKEIGISIHEYIIRRRIEESCYFVRRGREKIADIAAFYQFSSQSHFVKCFHEIMGVTPGEYRRTNSTQPALPGKTGPA